MHRGALDGLYAEWRQLTAEAFIRGEKWRRLTITTLWNITVLMLAIVTPNITIAIELLGKCIVTLVHMPVLTNKQY